MEQEKVQMEEPQQSQNLFDRPGGILGTGCLIIVSIGVVGAIVLGWLGHEMLEANSDPEMRKQIAQEFLQAETIPEDMSAVVAMSMRGTMELIVLSDKPLLAGEDTPHFTNEGLYFMRVKGQVWARCPASSRNSS